MECASDKWFDTDHEHWRRGELFRDRDLAENCRQRMSKAVRTYPALVARDTRDVRTRVSQDNKTELEPSTGEHGEISYPMPPFQRAYKHSAYRVTLCLHFVSTHPGFPHFE